MNRHFLAAWPLLLATPLFAATPTFHKDVEPILQVNCQTCHRPGEAGPFSLLTYETSRPWAKAIKTAVVAKKMPPWFADPRYSHFANAPKITQTQIDIISAWADGGAPEGDKKDAPKPIAWPEGWQIKPDVVKTMVEPFPVPDKGIVELTNVLIPGFENDTWVTSMEVRPGAPAVVHHMVLSLRKHTAETKYGPIPVAAKDRDADGAQVRRVTRDADSKAAASNNFTGLLNVWVPGTPPMDFRHREAAMLIPGGYDLVLGMHYTPVGKATSDQTKIGFTIAKGEPKRQWVTMSPTSPHDEERFRIPAGDAAWESTTEVVFNENAELVWFMPHMHLRGKSMEYTLKYPTGENQIVLNVPRYDFEWQLGYDLEKPIVVPKGSHLHVSAIYDNSANNKFNPNPKIDVYWGDQT